MCKELGILIADDNTEWGNVYITFLGVLFDGRNHVLCLLVDK